MSRRAVPSQPTWLDRYNGTTPDPARIDMAMGILGPLEANAPTDACYRITRFHFSAVFWNRATSCTSVVAEKCRKNRFGGGMEWKTSQEGLDIFDNALDRIGKTYEQLER